MLKIKFENSPIFGQVYSYIEESVSKDFNKKRKSTKKLWPKKK